MKSLVIVRENVEKKLTLLTKELKKKKIDFDIVKFHDVDEFYAKIHEKGYKNTYDILISFGGDGTILHSARVARKLDIPILGINAGTVGFLTSVNDVSGIGEALESVKKKKYIYDRRYMLDVKVIRDKKVIMNSYAVNEASVVTADLSIAGDYEISIDNENEVFNKYKSDGIIVASPTGSTAYSLSAGGPIVAPDVDCFIITPICPHAFNQRSLVVNGEKTIFVKIFKNNQHVSIDGRVDEKLMKNDIVKISKLKKYVNYINFKENSFIKNIQNKIKNI